MNQSTTKFVSNGTSHLAVHLFALNYREVDTLSCQPEVVWVFVTHTAYLWKQVKRKIEHTD
jgi:hypothetical protein